MSRAIMCSKEILEKNLSDKIYIVTGTTSGIGLETVTQLAKQSATVICASRNIWYHQQGVPCIDQDHCFLNRC